MSFAPFTFPTSVPPIIGPVVDLFRTRDTAADGNELIDYARGQVRNRRMSDFLLAFSWATVRGQIPPSSAVDRAVGIIRENLEAIENAEPQVIAGIRAAHQAGIGAGRLGPTAVQYGQERRGLGWLPVLLIVIATAATAAVLARYVPPAIIAAAADANTRRRANDRAFQILDDHVRAISAAGGTIPADVLRALETLGSSVPAASPTVADSIAQGAGAAAGALMPLILLAAAAYFFLKRNR
jgi:hypothetical protein